MVLWLMLVSLCQGGGTHAGENKYPPHLAKVLKGVRGKTCSFVPSTGTDPMDR